MILNSTEHEKLYYVRGQHPLSAQTKTDHAPVQRVPAGGAAPISNPDLASPAASISIWGVKSGPISSLDFYDSDV